MTQIPVGAADRFVLVGGSDGRTIVAAESPLRRLNYFDGKYLKADDLRREQDYLRELVAASNRAGGAGVVHGFDVGLQQGDELVLGAGLAIDGRGRVLLSPQRFEMGIGELISLTRRRFDRPLLQPLKQIAGFEECQVVRQEEPLEPVRSTVFYLITIAHAEALCGEEDVYGKLCEQACITSTARPYLVEGVLLRARPIALDIDWNRSAKIQLETRRHLRSLAASAYFGLEARRLSTLVSGAGLRSDDWCQGADPVAGIEVPVALLARRGETTLFLDAWTARRERIEPPSRRYWAWRMRMRPWDVFLAHVLQFQCQLRGLLRDRILPDGEEDACRPEREILLEARESIKSLKSQMAGLQKKDRSRVDAIRMPGTDLPLSEELLRLFRYDQQIVDVIRGTKLRRARRILIDGGIVELPSAGFLPVDPGSAEPLESQVRRWMGGGVDLRFCAVRADYVPHAFEEAQHMERIDLLVGLDDPARKPRVDILVPNGRVEELRRPPRLDGYRFGFGTLAAPINTGPGEFIPAPPDQPEGIEAMKRGMKMLDMDVSPLIKSLSEDMAKRAPGILEVMRQDGRIIGAARGEGRPGGGGVFHLAGTAGGRELGGAVGLIRVLEHYARELRPIEGVEEAAEEVPSPMESFFMAADSAIGAVDADAVDAAIKAMKKGAKKGGKRAGGKKGGAARAAAAPEMRAMEYVALAPGMYEHAPIAGLPNPAEGAAAIWATASSGADVFGLGAGEITEMELRVIGAGGAAAGAAVDMRVRGSFVVRQPARSAGGMTEVTGAFDGRRTTEAHMASGKSVCAGAGFRGTIRIQRLDDDPSRNAVRIFADVAGDASMVLLTHWPATGFGADSQLLVGLEADGGVSYMIGLDLVRDTGIFNPQNQTRRAAESAIDAIGAILPDREFAERAKKDLFRPADVLRESRVVRTDEDWVLFHRRRDIDCGEAARPETPPPVIRRLTAHVLPLAEKTIMTLEAQPAQDRPKQLLQIMENRRAHGATSVGPVEFAGDTAQITSPMDPFRSNLVAAGAGPNLVVGMIAARGDALADPESLHLARLTTLVGALPPVTQPPAESPYAVLPGLLDLLDAGATDGVILLATDRPREPATVIHDVYMVNDWDNLVRVIQAQPEKDPRTLPEFGRMTLRLESIGFTDGAAKPEALGDVEKSWKLNSQSDPTAVVSVAPDVESAARATEAEQVAGIWGIGHVNAVGLAQPVGSFRPIILLQAPFGMDPGG